MSAGFKCPPALPAPMEPTDDQLRALLQGSRTIAVVGMSKNPDKDAHRIPARLLAWGYQVIPINPTADEILGQRCYASLREAPRPIDIVDVFRPSEDVPPVVEEAIEAGAKAVWMQTGIRHPQAAARARAAGLLAVQDQCITVAHRRLLGA